jgi:3-deoxy-D-manno-octulosonic-acid transferase
MSEEERDNWLNKLCLYPEDDIWVAGSVHGEEGQIVLNVFLKLAPDFPKLRLIIAPRNIEESGGILKAAQDMGLEAILKTGMPDNKMDCKVVVLNTIGELGRIYGIAKISFVGGSLVPSGGHNLLEPAGFGCPVLFGPHTHNFVLMSELLLEEKGGFKVNNEQELYASVKKLLEDPELCSMTGKYAKQFTDKHKGALQEVLNRIDENVDDNKSA